jgi:hypothetical protein
MGPPERFQLLSRGWHGEAHGDCLPVTGRQSRPMTRAAPQGGGKQSDMRRGPYGGS